MYKITQVFWANLLISIQMILNLWFFFYNIEEYQSKNVFNIIYL